MNFRVLLFVLQQRCFWESGGFKGPTTSANSSWIGKIYQNSMATRIFRKTPLILALNTLICNAKVTSHSGFFEIALLIILIILISKTGDFY